MEPPDPNKELYQSIDTNPDWFEFYLLVACLKSHEFALKVKDVLCVSAENKDTSVNDFSFPADNVIYQGARTFRRMTFSQAKPSDVVPVTFIQQMVAAALRNGDMLEEQVQPINNRLNLLMQYDLAGMAPILEIGLSYWLGKKRTKKLMLERAGDDNWSPEDMAREMSLAVSSARLVKDGEYAHEFGAGIKRKELDVKRLPSGLHMLDKAMGGGFAYGEGTLLISPTGGGKTVAACQLGATFALNNYGGLFITTEQKHKELEPRTVSNLCNIPFEMIKDGVHMEKLSQEHQVRVEELMERIGKHMVTLDWIDVQKTVLEDLEHEIQKYNQKYGRCHWLLFDWLGGGMGMITDPKVLANLRHVYQNVADHMCVLASRYDLVAIGLAQANIMKSKNNIRLDSSCIHDNTQLGRKMTTILGLSAIMEPIDQMEGSDGGAPPYRRKQFLYVSKARKGAGGLVPVERAYEYQRLKTWEGGKAAA